MFFVLSFQQCAILITYHLQELGEFFNSGAEDNLDVFSAHFFYPQKS